MFKLVILDLDKTVWDHEDATSLKPPFIKHSSDKVVDSEGTVVKLNSGVKSFLETCNAVGIRVSIASWNKPKVTFELLNEFGLLKYFQNPVIEFHPEKDRMIDKILKRFKRQGRNFKQDEIVFVDDNPDMLAKVKMRFPKMRTILFGVDVAGFNELKSLLGAP